MGGDLAGVRERLPHLKGLGINTIWLSPVYPSPYSHGYHPKDYLDVDASFGSVAELKSLVAEAKAQGIRMVYDLVPNHTSATHPWFVDAQARCSESTSYDWYSFDDCPDRYATFYDIAELPELNLDTPAARAYMLDEVVPFYLEEVGFDGFRLDYAKGPSLDFWQAFAAKSTRSSPTRSSSAR